MPGRFALGFFGMAAVAASWYGLNSRDCPLCALTILLVTTLLFLLLGVYLLSCGYRYVGSVYTVTYLQDYSGLTNQDALMMVCAISGAN
jgi:hypothetical protein